MTTPLLGIMLSLALTPTVFGAAAGDYVPESQNASELFLSKVLKVYACQEGEIHYIAYVVSWRGHEVVATAWPGDPSTKRHEVGDSIRCRMHHFTRTTDTGTTTQTQFVLVSNVDHEHARLQAIEAGIEARRALRESIRSTTPANTP